MSSKGFPIHEDGLSETAKILEFASPDIQEALLVSAYDIHHRYLQDVDRMLGADHGSTIYGTPKLLVVDSGGYELNPQDWEGGETRRGTYVAQPYDEADFHSVTDQLPQDRPLLVVSYDDPRADQATYSEQRERAQAFFAPRPHLLSDFLLKPAPNEWVINIDGLTSEANNLAAFHVVGVTEKDLGDDLLTRLKTLARLRTLLDEHGCENKPIHVFGSLDPLWTPLYFMAGAELFDGLSWMRYAYHEGLAIHPDELAVLTSQLDASQQRRHQLRFMSNLTALGKIRRDLIRWAAEPDDWGHLGPHSDLLRQIYSTMCAELGQRG